MTSPGSSAPVMRDKAKPINFCRGQFHLSSDGTGAVWHLNDAICAPANVLAEVSYVST
jgi:hypothetical protein